MVKKVIYPGTFDPVTVGHMDIIRRASEMFETVVVAVSVSRDKTPLFSLGERLEMMEQVTEPFSNVTVKGFSSLLVEFAKEEEARVIIRGLRAVSDFEYELQVGYANQSLDPSIETIYLMPSLDHAFVSSSVVRSILRHDGRVDHLVPKSVQSLLARRVGEKQLGDV